MHWECVYTSRILCMINVTMLYLLSPIHNFMSDLLMLMVVLWHVSFWCKMVLLCIRIGIFRCSTQKAFPFSAHTKISLFCARFVYVYDSNANVLDENKNAFDGRKCHRIIWCRALDSARQCVVSDCVGYFLFILMNTLPRTESVDSVPIYLAHHANYIGFFFYFSFGIVGSRMRNGLRCRAARHKIIESGK